jgi:P-type Cu+ transporter
METARSFQHTEEKTVCYHCGDDCSGAAVKEDDHLFCCEGCRLVFDLLKENNLCTYYDITKSPGRSATDPQKRSLYASLDDPAVRGKIICFENDSISRVTFHIPAMHCSSCIWLLEHLRKINPAIVSSTVNFPRKEVTVDFQHARTRLSEIAILLASTGYEPAISLGDLEAGKEKRIFNPRVIRIGVAGFCFGNIMMLSFPDYLAGGDLTGIPQLQNYFSWISLVISMPVLFYCASGFFSSARKAIRHRSLNIDAPIALAIVVTFLRSAYEIITATGTGYLDSMSGIVFFMLLGRFFQDRTYENISFDRDYKSYFPIAVAVSRNGKEESVPVTKIKPGDLIVIRSGELIPADAKLLSRDAEIDYSFVTGEAAPVRCHRGDKIFAGARQAGGVIMLEVLKETSQSYLTQLWNNDAFGKKARDENKTYVDSINRWFSAAVLLISSGSAAVWFFIDKSMALNVMTAVLIVACPCTLLLASTFTNGHVLRRLGRKKFYLKNAAVIARLATADTVIFDKTGTITETKSAAVHFEGEKLSEEEQAEVYALASQSNHPLSRQIAASIGERNFCEIKNFTSLNGKGIMASVNGKHWALGSRAFVHAEKPGAQPVAEAWVSAGGKIRGRFLVRNNYRAKLKNVIDELKPRFSVQLLSGDHDSEKETLRKYFGSEMYFEYSPQQKLEHVRALQQAGKKVIMIGDGLNDAGALRQADAGIVVSDNMNNYFPACDAILDGEMFEKLPALLRFTTVAQRVVTASFIVSVLYNFIGIYFAVSGELSPLVAAILMPASSFSVIALTTLAVRIPAGKLA